MKFPIFVLIVFIQHFSFITSSDGDRSPFYQNCVRNSLKVNCTEDGKHFMPQALLLQDPWSNLMRWGCRDESRYHCMWRTVEAFKLRGYSVPKFHGKWPFKRYLGVQEPASALCSLFNLWAHLYMWRKIIKDRRFSYTNTPLFAFWNAFVLVCLNAWFWSTIFHTRDTPFTEFMDYACALSMVMALFVAAVVRIFYGRLKTISFILLTTLIYFVAHVRYLYSERVDYFYNMVVNIIFGVFGSVLWLGFALVKRRRPSGKYVRPLATFTCASALALTLEMIDFPPLAGVWDAHALWHLATAPLPLLFYRFVIDDMDFMQTYRAMEETSKLTDKVDLKLA